MPLLNSLYRPPLFFSNKDLQTVYASIFRRAGNVSYRRQRIETPDGDFLDLDWAENQLVNKSKKLVIISHGMEGSSNSKYVLCIIPNLIKAGFNCLAWNFRGCSGTANLKLRFYHSGASDDLDCVIKHVILEGFYEEIVLIGFSMGGNITLKYLGEQGSLIPTAIRKAVTIAVPCDLKSSVASLARSRNFIYMKRFLKLLKTKIKIRAKLFPDIVSINGYNEIKNFVEFDKRFTAPIHGFKSEEDYWQKCSSRQYIGAIKIPTLLINAKDDPFLGDMCYPKTEALVSKHFFLETPDYGGHVGFIDFSSKGIYWSEKRAIEFINETNVI